MLQPIAVMILSQHFLETGLQCILPKMVLAPGDELLGLNKQWRTPQRKLMSGENNSVDVLTDRALGPDYPQIFLLPGGQSLNKFTRMTYVSRKRSKGSWSVKKYPQEILQRYKITVSISIYNKKYTVKIIMYIFEYLISPLWKS